MLGVCWRPPHGTRRFACGHWRLATWCGSCALRLATGTRANFMQSHYRLTANGSQPAVGPVENGPVALVFTSLKLRADAWHDEFPASRRPYPVWHGRRTVVSLRSVFTAKKA